MANLNPHLSPHTTALQIMWDTHQPKKKKKKKMFSFYTLTYMLRYTHTHTEYTPCF